MLIKGEFEYCIFVCISPIFTQMQHLTDLYTNKSSYSSKKSDFSQINHTIYGYKTPMAMQIMIRMAIGCQIFMLDFLLNIPPR